MKFEQIYHLINYFEVLYTFFIFSSICGFLLNFSIKLHNREIEISVVKLNFKFFLKCFIILIIYHLYFIYFCFIVPCFIFQNIINFSKLLSNILIKTNFEIYKPQYDKLDIFSFHNSLKLIFIYFPKTWSFLLIYTICMPKLKKNFSILDILSNIGIIFLSTRPMWFWNLSLQISEEIINVLYSDVWKRKKIIKYPILLTKDLIYIYYKILFKKTLFYNEIINPLILDIKKFKLNGLEFILGKMQSSKQIIIFDQFRLLSLSGFPHIVLTQEDKSYGQIMTKSKKLFIPGTSKPIETHSLNKEQKMVFSLFNKEDLIKDQQTCNEKMFKMFKTLQINSPEKFMGFMYKANLLYLTEISDKILWQNTDKDLSMVLSYDTLPIIDEDSASYKGNPLIYLRYKYSTELLHRDDFWKDLELLEKAKKEIEDLDIEEMYLKVKNANHSDLAIVENHLRNMFNQFEKQFE